jgi:mono/diheme cytochrome c family protein
MRLFDARLKPSRHVEATKSRSHDRNFVSLLCFHAFVAVSVVALSGVAVVSEQSPRYKVGRTPTGEEINAWDIAIGPDGRELPPGQGTVARGKTVYAEQCTRCHGATATEGPEMPLVGGQGSLNTSQPLKTVGSYWPYATTLFDYINRAMPFDRPTVLSADDVYAVTAYLLHLNGIIKEQDVMDARTLPAVKMPNRDGFVPDPRPDVGKATRPHQER